MNVKGIGEKSFLKLKGLIHGGASRAEAKPARHGMPSGSGTPMRRRRGEPAGWSLVELVMVIGVSLVVGALALAAFAPLGAGARAIGAARYLAALLQRGPGSKGRTAASAACASTTTDRELVSCASPMATPTACAAPRSPAGIDPVRGPRVRLADAFAGVRFAIVADVPAIDGGPAILAAGADPVRLGSSILAFAPTGSATSGTLYLASADRQFAVRILGATGRVRTFEFPIARPRAGCRDEPGLGASGGAALDAARPAVAHRLSRRARARRRAIVNLSAVGVLIEVAAPLPPGRAVTVHLVRSSRRVALAGAGGGRAVAPSRVTRPPAPAITPPSRFALVQPLWELGAWAARMNGRAAMLERVWTGSEFPGYGKFFHIHPISERE